MVKEEAVPLDGDGLGQLRVGGHVKAGCKFWLRLFYLHGLDRASDERRVARIATRRVYWR